MVLGRRLREPHVAPVSAQVARLEGIGHVLFDDDGAARGVDEPGALLHLANEVLVEEAVGPLVERAVDRHDIALRDHLLQVEDATAADLFLNFGTQGLEEKLFELEGFHKESGGGGGCNLVVEV